MNRLDVLAVVLVLGWVPVAILMTKRFVRRRHPISLAFVTLVLFAMYLNLAPVFAHNGVSWWMIRSGIYVAEGAVLLVFYLCIWLASRWTPPPLESEL